MSRLKFTIRKTIQPLIILLVFFQWQLFAQDEIQTSGSELVNHLIDAYNEFDYNKCAELLNIAFQSIDNFSPEDRKQIYQYAAFTAFENGNITLTENHFWNLLEIDPTFSPNPITTSPKLLTIFQKTKIAYLEEMNKRIRQAERLDNSQPVPWRAFLFPGWEQWNRGYKKRGLIYAGAGAAALTGLIYSAITARQKKDDYQGATDPREVQSLYNEYNSHYRRQFYFGYAFAAVWVFSQFDLLVWNRPKISIRAFSSPGANREVYPSVALKIQL